MDNFGEYVRELRKRNRLTLKEAEALGVASNAYLSQLERGHRRRPHPDILKRMAEVYKEPPRNLMIAAGYLTPETVGKSPEEQLEHAYSEVLNDSRVSHGTRHRGPKLSLDAKRVVVEMYENLTGRKLL
jgi:HTH-type transcriptional regulator, competence development regulator